MKLNQIRQKIKKEKDREIKKIMIMKKPKVNNQHHKINQAKEEEAEVEEEVEKAEVEEKVEKAEVEEEVEKAEVEEEV